MSIAESYEMGPIRPSSEAYSLFVRVTRNCPWNRCKFCYAYKGSKFEIRSVADIKKDIDTAQKYYDAIKEAASKMGCGGNIHKAARALANTTSNESFYNIATWLFAGTELTDNIIRIMED